jgi:hypothetical protein
MFLYYLQCRIPLVECSELVLVRVMEHGWPRGLAELEDLVRALAALDTSTIGEREFSQVGFRGGSDMETAGLSGLDAEIVQVLRQAPGMAMRELAGALSRSRRTLLRHLSELLSSSRVVRRGRGRASRYELSATGLASALKGSDGG